MIKIDIKDKKILYYLKKNSRQSFTQIGKKVGLSKEIVRYRIKRLENEGVIQEYYTQIEVSYFGYMGARFYYTLQFASPDIKKEIIDYFTKSKQVQMVIEFKGAYDLQVSTWLSLHDYQGRFNSFYDETQRKFRDYFDEQIGTGIRSSEVFDCIFLLGEKDKKPTSLTYESKKPIKVDDIDMKILHILNLNSRTPTIDIAKELNSTVNTINKRIQKLTRAGIILGYSIVIDWLKIGYQSYIIEINLKNYKEKYRIIDYIRNNPNLWFIMSSFGHNVDLEFEFVLENIDQLHEIVKDLSSRFPDTIKNFKYFSMVKIHKWNELPLLLS